MRSWERGLFRPVAIAAMVGCVALSLAELAALISPGWRGTYLVVGCMLAALEANYSYRLIKPRRLRGADALRFRAFEITLLLLLVKAGSYIGTSWPSVVADLQRWPAEPSTIFSAGDFFVSLMVIGAWLSATATVRDIERISQPLETQRNTAQYVRSITGRFFLGGALLMIGAGLTRIGISALLELDHPPVPRLVAYVLAYFLLGLVMLGQVHLSRMRRQWQSQDIKGVEAVSSHWVRYSLLLIGIAVVLAGIIPIGYAGGVLETGAAVINAVLYVLSILLWLLSTIVSLVLWLISGLFETLFGRGDLRSPPLEPMPRRSVVPPVGVPFIIPPWLELARTAVFWAGTLAMVLYVVRSYLRDHPEVLEALRSLRLMAAMRAPISSRRRRVGGLVQAVRELPGRRIRPRRQPASRFRFLRLGAQSPRERVLYYYLSTLRRASRIGVPRRHSQTPHEYNLVLGPRLADSEGALAALTEAFVEARYSPHEVERDRERQVRRHWRRVKVALRALRREAEAAEGD